MTATPLDLAARAAARRPPAAGQPGAPPPVGSGRKPKGDRWQTFNGFIDLVAPRLTLAERSVWLVMFRHARAGVVETSDRLIAGVCEISPSTARAALERLRDAGLVWPVWLSRDRSRASKYGLHPRPWECLEKLDKPAGTAPAAGAVGRMNRPD